VYVGKDENLTLTHSYSCLIYDFPSSLEHKWSLPILRHCSKKASYTFNET